MTEPRYTPLIKSLSSKAPFVSPDTQERLRGKAYAARLGANENGFGPSPKVIEAVKSVAGDVWMYGDELSFELRGALAAKHTVNIDNITVGEGIDGLLGNLARLVVENGTSVVTSIGGYPTFNYHVNAFGGTLHGVPYKDDKEDLDGLLQMVIETNATMVYLANPDNPMASWHSKDAVAKFINALPETCLLCLDEAYVEFAPQDDVMDIEADRPNVIRFRTFSKAHGMAGLRVGYGIAAPDLVSAFNKIRNHFGVNRLAQVGALAALADEEWLANTVKRVNAAKARIGEIAKDNGFVALPSATNFVAIDTGRDGHYAKAIVGACDASDVFIRMPFAAPENRCLRVSAGPENEIELFGLALADAVKSVA